MRNHYKLAVGITGTVLLGISGVLFLGNSGISPTRVAVAIIPPSIALVYIINKKDLSRFTLALLSLSVYAGWGVIIVILGEVFPALK